jgi:putative FmdB family regulatory protein
MVNRAYYCKSCEHEFETVQKMSDKILKKCPECKKNSLVQDLSGGTMHCSVKAGSHEVKTIGHMADLNTRKMSKWEIESKQESINKKDQELKRQRDDNLRKAGIEPYKPAKSDYSIPDAPAFVKERIKKGDSAGIKKYIKEGK